MQVILQRIPAETGDSPIKKVVAEVKPQFERRMDRILLFYNPGQHPIALVNRTSATGNNAIVVAHNNGDNSNNINGHNNNMVVPV
jgi:hypothetical protein